MPFSELLSRGSRVLGREATSDPISLVRDWQVGVQTARGRLCWTQHMHLYTCWGLSSVDAQGHNLHAPSSSSLFDPLPAWAGPGFGAGGRGRDLEGSSSLSDEGTPAGETGQDQRWSAHLNSTLFRTHTFTPSLGTLTSCVPMMSVPPAHISGPPGPR